MDFFPQENSELQKIDPQIPGRFAKKLTELDLFSQPIPARQVVISTTFAQNVLKLPILNLEYLRAFEKRADKPTRKASDIKEEKNRALAAP